MCVMTLDDHIIRHPDFENIIAQIVDCHESKKNGRKAKNLKIMGVSGVGKTSLLKSYVSCHPRYDDFDRTIIPVLYVVVPSRPSESALYAAILLALGDPFPSKGKLAEQKYRIFTFLEKCRVELIILDEIQHFLDRGKLATHAAVADCLKVLVETSNIPTIFSGAPRGLVLFKVNTQLRGRFKTTAVLSPFSTFTPKKLSRFSKLVKALMKNTDFENVDFFDNPDFLNRLFYATDGILRNVADLLGDAAENTKKANIFSLSIPILERIFDTWLAGEKYRSINPFRKSAEPRRLTMKGEPFEPSELDGDNHGWGEIEE
jgi:hypothetical protein